MQIKASSQDKSYGWVARSLTHRWLQRRTMLRRWW